MTFGQWNRIVYEQNRYADCVTESRAGSALLSVLQVRCDIILSFTGILILNPMTFRVCRYFVSADVSGGRV